MPQYEKIKGRTKRCKRCGVYKDFSEFYQSSYTKSGCSGWCRWCNMNSKYGINETEYNALLLKQNNACAICLNSFTVILTPCVDHIKGTNIVRGLLCRSCNIGIGNLKDSESVVRRAALYLEFSNYERHTEYDHTTHITI